VQKRKKKGGTVFREGQRHVISSPKKGLGTEFEEKNKLGIPSRLREGSAGGGEQEPPSVSKGGEKVINRFVGRGRKKRKMGR